MAQKGMTLLEMVGVMAIIMLGIGVAIPAIRAYMIESTVLGAARVFHGEFLLARSTSIRTGAQTAIRFEQDDELRWWYSTYVDRDRDGVRSDDITRGIDRRISGPLPLSGKAPGVRVAVIPGTPSIPPDSGPLGDDPIRFGKSDMLSFSPLGTASPGTFYLAGQAGLQAAVRVTPGSARVRILVFRGAWQER